MVENTLYMFLLVGDSPNITWIGRSCGHFSFRRFICYFTATLGCLVVVRILCSRVLGVVTSSRNDTPMVFEFLGTGQVSLAALSRPQAQYLGS